MGSKCISFCIFVTLLYVSYVNAEYSLCGNWQSYRDEKCVKLLDTESFVTFEDAVKLCSQIDNSELLTIHSKREQDFISEYLFENHKLKNGVWLGLRTRSMSYEWLDSSSIPYTNWLNGKPSNKPDTNCVELEPITSQWSNDPCDDKNLVVCQKLPDVSLLDLMKAVIQTKNTLTSTIEDLVGTKEELSKTNQVLELTKERLKKAEVNYYGFRNNFNEIIDYHHHFVLYNSRKIRNFYLFTDPDGRSKAFIIPYSTMKFSYNFDDSVHLCNEFNSTLIEIQSPEKQIILEEFLRETESKSEIFKRFWINAQKDSTGKWRWLNTGNELPFTNWGPDQPTADDLNNNLIIHIEYKQIYGQWGNIPKTSAVHVICEHTFEFSDLYSIDKKPVLKYKPYDQK